MLHEIWYLLASSGHIFFAFYSFWITEKNVKLSYFHVLTESQLSPFIAKKNRQRKQIQIVRMSKSHHFPEQRI